MPEVMESTLQRLCPVTPLCRSKSRQHVFWLSPKLPSNCQSVWSGRNRSSEAKSWGSGVLR